MPTEKLLSISEFAKIAQTTRRTLIFYGQKNRLKLQKMVIAIIVTSNFIKSALFWICVIWDYL